MADEIKDLEDLEEEAKRELLKAVAKAASKSDASRALRLAEAYAWVESPRQPHAGPPSE